MAHFIDRDKLHKPIHAEDDNITGAGMSYDELCGYNDGIDAAWSVINHAEVIELVHCYECKHFTHYTCKPAGTEGFRCELGGLTFDENDYCSYGEKK